MRNMENTEVQAWLGWLEWLKHYRVPEYDRVHVKQVGMFAWLRDLLESIAESDTAKLEATLSVKPYEFYIDINAVALGKMAEVTALFKNVDVKVLKAILIKYKNKFDKDLDFTYWCVCGDEKWKFAKVQMYLDILEDVRAHTENSDLAAKDRCEIECAEANKRLDIELHKLHEKEKEEYWKLVRKLTFETIAAAEEAHKDDKMSAYCAALVFSRVTDVWDKKLFAVKQKTIRETKISEHFERLYKAHNFDLPYGFEGMSKAYFETHRW